MAGRRPHQQRGNLAVEVTLDDEPHAELVMQEDGTVDLGTKAQALAARRQGLGMPGAQSADLRKFRFTS
jgi:hypothetical protein